MTIDARRMPESPLAAAKPAPLIAIGAALVALVATLFLPQILNDGDTWWHLKVGQWIIAHRSVPQFDSFSYTHAGDAWGAHEWLSELLFAVSYGLADWRGVAVLCGLAVGAAVWLMARKVAADLSGVALLAALAISVGMLAPSLLARPHVLALPAMAAWIIGLVEAREGKATPSLWLLPWMCLWANLHGSFAFGLALIAPFALEALLDAAPKRRLATLGAWVFFAAGAGLAALATPYGFEGLLFPLKLVSLPALAGIGEWQPQDFSRLGPFEIALLALLAAALVRPVRMPVVRLIVLLGLVHLSLSQARHQMLLGVVGPILLAKPLANAFPGAVPGALRRSGGWRSALAAAAVLLAVGVRLAVPLVRTNGPTSPIAALAAAPDPLTRGRVLNDYAFGGYLIWRGVPVFIDSRAELYGEQSLREYAKLVEPDRPTLDSILDRYSIGWTIFAPSQPLVKLLDVDPAWRRVYADRFAVIHERVRNSSVGPSVQ